MNEPMRKQLGENKIGDKCYSAIYNLDKKCDWCIYEDLKEKNKIEYEHKIDNHSKMIRNVLLDNQSKLTVFYDITNRKESEKTLKESEEKFRKIINSANDAVILIDNNEKIAMWNIAAQKIFGYSEEEINYYLHTGDWKGKAGAYAIQGLGRILVRGIIGCYYNVVGLPISLIHEELLSLGIKLFSGNYC